MDPNIDRKSYDPDQWLGGSDNDENDNKNVDVHPAHKKIFVIAIVTVVLVALAVIIAVLFTWPGIQPAPLAGPVDTSTRIDRPGYENLAAYFGDPAALTQSPREDVVAYQPDSIVDACNLLSIQLIRKQNLLIKPSVKEGVVDRNYFDGTSKEIVKFWQTSPILIHELNDCGYDIVNKKGEKTGSLYLQIHQPSYASGPAIRKALDNYLIRGSQIEGVNIYDSTQTPIKGADTTYFYLEKDQVYLDLEINIAGKGSKRSTDALLNGVAKQLAESIEKPVGPAQYTYVSSTFDGLYVSACEISDASYIKKLYKKPASPSVHERLATATGIVENRGEKSNFISNQCVRSTAEEKSKASTLTVTTRSFESELAAKLYMESLESSDTIEIAASIEVGDETRFNPVAPDREATIIFVEDSTVVTMSMFPAGGQKITSDKYIEMLLPVAASVLELLYNYEADNEEKDDAAKEAEVKKATETKENQQ